MAGIIAIILSFLYLKFILNINGINGIKRVFYPADFFSLFYVLFFLLPYGFFWFFRDTLSYRYVSEPYNDSTWVLALLYSFLFTLSAYVASRLTCNRSDFTSKLYNLSLSTNNGFFYKFFYIILPVLSIVFCIIKFGGASYQEYSINRTKERSGLGYVLMPIYWGGVGIVVYWLRNVFNKRFNLFSAVALLSLIVIYTAFNLYMGSKSKGLVVLVWIVICWFLLFSSKKAIKLRSVISTAVFIFLVGYVGLKFGDIREVLTKDVELSSVESRTQIGSVFSKFNAFGSIENTMWLVENKDLQDVTLGSTFYTVAVGWVPRSIWKEKPVGGGPTLRNLIHPGSYDIVNGFQLSSYSPGIIAESYINFGFFGFIIVGIPFGVFLSFFARMLSLVNNDYELVTWVICLYAIGYMMTGEVFGTFARLFQFILPIVMLFFLSLFFKKFAKV
ncbi:O-antigen polysaccharide polymerase Wzy [Vibrio sp. MarTm2]|uniref:O-antigen polysaccharide polymerase Wzy n=1 Tax=Vibrio sp. MarTm2 TaxID=2998831 RepID=UPI0022CD3B8E|nr:O-antigen polysaccharide polymerase Wzy [Vibrio sp. MarTm2]MDA0129877.1 O-antigen polysaccharide polymerase Wzy [Vibrio sp. MarTm2]